MKRMFSFLFMMTMLLTLTSACSNDNTEPDPGTAPGGTVDPSNPGKILVTYFSYSGNTRQLANQIAELTGGDTFEVIPINPYPTDFDECVAQARRERAEGYKPLLKNRIENIDDYDVIFVGFPIWGDDNITTDTHVFDRLRFFRENRNSILYSCRLWKRAKLYNSYKFMTEFHDS